MGNLKPQERRSACSLLYKRPFCGDMGLRRALQAVYLLAASVALAQGAAFYRAISDQQRGIRWHSVMQNNYEDDAQAFCGAVHAAGESRGAVLQAVPTRLGWLVSPR